MKNLKSTIPLILLQTFVISTVIAIPICLIYKTFDVFRFSNIAWTSLAVILSYVFLQGRTTYLYYWIIKPHFYAEFLCQYYIHFLTTFFGNYSCRL